MTVEELQKALKNGQVGQIQLPPQEAPKVGQIDDSAKMIPIFEMLRRPKYHVTTAPTAAPKSFLEQIEFYDDGVNRRIYFYINNSWRYATLT